MNCLEFHRQKLADPRHLAAEARHHARECHACHAFAQSVDEADAQIERALNVAVPKGLAERVLLRHSVTTRPAWRAWALAASIVLVVTLGFNQLNGGLTDAFKFGTSRNISQDQSAQAVPPGESKGMAPDEYARQAIGHVVDEPGSFTMFYNTEPGIFSKAIRSVGGEIKEPVGRVRYVKLCPLGERSGWHVVFETPRGLATLILVPDMHLSATAKVSENGWSVLVRPVGQGYYAVVTGSEKTTAIVDRLVRERINWKSY